MRDYVCFVEKVTNLRRSPLKMKTIRCLQKAEGPPHGVATSRRGRDSRYGGKEVGGGGGGGKT